VHPHDPARHAGRLPSSTRHPRESEVPLLLSYGRRGKAGLPLSRE